MPDDDGRFQLKHVALKEIIKCRVRRNSAYLCDWLDTTGRMPLNLFHWVNVSWHVRGLLSFHLQGFRYPRRVLLPRSCKRWKHSVCSKCQETLSQQHSVTSQKHWILNTAAVETSYLTHLCWSLPLKSAAFVSLPSYIYQYASSIAWFAIFFSHYLNLRIFQ